MNIFEALRKDHEKQRALLDSLLDTSGDSTHRANVYKTLKAEMEAHAAAEERHFYIPLMKHDLTQEKSRHSVAEHHELDELLETLDGTPKDSPAWLQHAKNLAHKLRHHLEEEEQEVFQMAGKVLTEKQKDTLADDYHALMNDQRSAA